MSKKIPKSCAKEVKTGCAISIKQPYIEEILRGIKKYEYISRPTKITERVFLYASTGKVKDEDRWKKNQCRNGNSSYRSNHWLC